MKKNNIPSPIAKLYYMDFVYEDDKKDPFLNEKNTLDRLWGEYEKYERIVVAYDFDNTVFDCHNKGYSFEKIIDIIRRCKEKNFYLIVFTASPLSRYDFIKQYLTDNDIPFDVINENPSFFESDSRKIYANILLDDRAGLPSAYNILNQLLNRID